MKRPIKFRGRDIDTGEFRYAELGEVSAELNPEYLTFITDDAYTIDTDSIAQLVGYDKDGKEVYEGDTVTITRSTQTYKVGTEFTARRGAYVVDDIRSIMHFISGDFKLKEDTK